MEEIWKKCPEYDDIEVSSLGKVRVISSKKEIKPFENMDKYLQVDLHKYTVSSTKLPTIHKLVAITFLSPHPEDGKRYVVDHKDMNTRNNEVDNLEWVTCAENAKRWKARMGQSYRRRCKIHVPELRKTFLSIAAASKETGIRLESIRAVSKWGSNGGTIKGLHFERIYEEEQHE